MHSFADVLSSLAIALMRKRELVALLLLSSHMSCYYKCSVALSHVAVGRPRGYKT